MKFYLEHLNFLRTEKNEKPLRGSFCKLSVQSLTFWEKVHIIKTIKVVIKLVI